MANTNFTNGAGTGTVGADGFTSSGLSASTIPNLTASGTITTTNATVSGVLTVGVGATAAPSVTFSGRTDAGVYSSGAHQVAVAASGNKVAFFTGSGVTLNTGVATLPTGATAAPTATFTGRTDVGIYSPAAHQLAVAASGAKVATFTGSGLTTSLLTSLLGGLKLAGASIAAAGATHGTATAVPNTAIWINVSTTTSTEGVKFVSIATNTVHILKAPTTKGIKVYATGSKIDGTATNTAVAIASNKAVLFWASGPTQLYTFKGA